MRVLKFLIHRLDTEADDFLVRIADKYHYELSTRAVVGLTPVYGLFLRVLEIVLLSLIPSGLIPHIAVPIVATAQVVSLIIIVFATYVMAREALPVASGKIEHAAEYPGLVAIWYHLEPSVGSLLDHMSKIAIYILLYNCGIETLSIAMGIVFGLCLLVNMVVHDIIIDNISNSLETVEDDIEQGSSAG